MNPLRAAIEALFGVVEEPAPTWTVQRAIDRDTLYHCGRFISRMRPGADDDESRIPACLVPDTKGRNATWLATANGAILGVSTGASYRGRFDLAELLVAEQFRRQGIGSALLSLARSHAHSHGESFSATVRETDTAGLRWLCNQEMQPLTYLNGRAFIVSGVFAECDAITMIESDEPLRARIVQ